MSAAPTLEAERAAFEATRKPRTDLNRKGNRYMNPVVQNCWETWQAARTATPAPADVALPPLDAEGLPPLPEPDTHCFDEDTETDVWSHSAEQVRQAQREAVEADRRSRISADQWASLEAARLQAEAAKLNRESRSAAYIDGRTAGTAPEGEKHVEYDAVSTMLWLYRRLPRGYERPPNIENPIRRLARIAGFDLKFVEDSFAERAAAPSPLPPQEDAK